MKELSGTATTVDGQEENALTAAFEKWFINRAIDPETAINSGIYTAQGGEILVFPFLENGVSVNEKYRRKGKKFSQKEGGKRTFWNWQGLELAAQEGKPLVITEGEIDALSALEAGYPWAVSVPDGAPQKRSDGFYSRDEDQKFKFLWNNESLLDKVKIFILAGDNDEPGRVLNHELQKRLGAERCKFITYPDRCKDLNDVLVAHGKQAVMELIFKAKDYPVVGLYRPDEFPPIPSEVKRPYSTGMGWQHDQHIKIILGRFMVVTGIPGHGKALSITTKIPTPDGWSTMGQLKTGDFIFDEKGQRTKILNATEVMYERECYEIEFSDGTKVICDADHKWVTRDDKARRSLQNARINNREKPRKVNLRGTDQTNKRTFPSEKTTLEIYQTLLVEKGKRKNHAIKICGPLRMKMSNLLIDPYVLGCWLGDGTSANGGFSTADKEILQYINDAGYKITKWSGKYSYGIGDLKRRLRKHNLINNKHIPFNYLFSSWHQRLRLLQGLMDTDGHITDYGRCEFTSMNIKLAKGVYELAIGLGIKARIIIGRAKLYGKDCGTKYRVTFTTSIKIFRLKRKFNCIKNTVRDTQNWRYIVGCKKVTSVPVRCIQVDSPSHQYLCTESMIPTHNSEWTDSLVLNLAREHDWKICVCSTEIDNEDYELNSIRRIICRPLEDVEGHVIEKAKQFYQDHFIFVTNNTMDVDMELTLEKLIDLAEIAIIRDDCKVLLLDPWNEIEHKRNSDETETEYTGRAIRMLKKLARQYHIFVIVVAHPKMPQYGKIQCPNLYSISGSANWANKADYGVIIWRDSMDGNTSEVRVAKIKCHGPMGKPGSIQVRLNAHTRRFEEESL